MAEPLKKSGSDDEVEGLTVKKSAPRSFWSALWLLVITSLIMLAAANYVAFLLGAAIEFAQTYYGYGQDLAEYLS